MAAKKRMRIVDARGKVKDSPDIRMTLDTSENPSFNGLGSRFKFKSTQKRKSEYGNYFHLEAVYSLEGGSYEVMIVEDASEVLDYAGIKPRMKSRSLMRRAKLMSMVSLLITTIT